MDYDYKEYAVRGTGIGVPVPVRVSVLVHSFLGRVSLKIGTGVCGMRCALGYTFLLRKYSLVYVTNYLYY